MFLELLGLQSFYDDLKSMNPEKRLRLIQFLVRQIEKESNHKDKVLNNFRPSLLIQTGYRLQQQVPDENH